MRIKTDIQELLKDTRPSTVDVHLTVNMSKWSILRAVIGIRIAAWGFRISGLPVEFNEVKDDGTDSDQRQQCDLRETGELGRQQGGV